MFFGERILEIYKEVYSLSLCIYASMCIYSNYVKYV